MENQENQQEPTKSSNPTMWIILVIVIILLGIGAYFLFIQDDTTNTYNANTTVNTNTTINENVNTISNTNSETNTNVVVNTNTTTNTNSSVDTSAWETYENSNLGFEIKRPPQWLWQGNQSGNLITNFMPAQENVADFCQLSIYEGSPSINDDSYQLRDTTTITIGDSLVTRQNYINASGELKLFTASISDDDNTIGFSSQIGTMFIDIDNLTCEMYLIGALESFKFSS